LNLDKLKQCNYCSNFKQLSEFSKQVRSKDGLQGECKSCNKLRKESRAKEHKIYMTKYYQDNKETLLKEQKQRDSLRKKEISIVKAKYYFDHKEELSEYKKEYRKANPHKINAKVAKRKAAKLQQTPEWLTDLQLSHIDMFYEAAAKLTKEFGIAVHVDHIVPLQGKDVRGLHVPWNLQLMFASDNVRKGNKT
jgi:hypothetical protein